MATRIVKSVLVAVAAVALLPTHPLVAGEDAVEPPLPTIIPPLAKELAQVNAALAKAKKEKDDTLLAGCLYEMAGVRKKKKNADSGAEATHELHRALKHKDWVPAIKKALKSKNEKVRAYALQAAATHDLKEAAPIAKKLLKAKKKSKDKAVRGMVAAAAISYLARMEIKGEEKTVFELHLKPIFIDQNRMRKDASKDMMRAGLRYLGKMKYKPCVGWLIEQLPEPYPKNPNSASNPPASYWEARYKLWQASEGWVRWALLEITEEKYRSEREWKAWFRKNKKAYDKK